MYNHVTVRPSLRDLIYYLPPTQRWNAGLFSDVPPGHASGFFARMRARGPSRSGQLYRERGLQF